MPQSSLSASARAALLRARDMPFSYGVRTYSVPGDSDRVLVVLGEAHLKLGAASALGKEIVGAFDLRGVEIFQRRQVVMGTLLGFLIHFPRWLLRQLSFGIIKDSTIVDARASKTGTTVAIEKTDSVPFALHAASIYLTLFFLVAGAQLAVSFAFGVRGPRQDIVDEIMPWLTLVTLAFELHMILLIPAWVMRRQKMAWMIHPAIGLVSARDMLMAKGTARMFHDHPSAGAALVIMGRAHLPGFEREIIDHHGYRRIPL